MSWETVWFGNTLWKYAVAAGVFAGIWGAMWLFKTVILTRLRELAQKTHTDFDEFLIESLARLRNWFYLAVSTYFATRPLALPEGLHRGVRYFLVLTLGLHAVAFLQRLAAYAIEKGYRREAATQPSTAATVRTLQAVSKWAIWAVGAVFLLDNLGYEISAVVAGLGIGGVAVALAAQAILGDLFSAFSIYIDRPFEVGDSIVVGDLTGVVEHVGFKTTRVRSLGGEQLVFSNADLTTSRIRNFKRMRDRRIVFRLGVTYQTPPEQMRRIPTIVREIIEGVEGTRFDRAHFMNFGDFALIVEVVYFVLSPDYNRYMDLQQAINLAIQERFAREGIEFAYPTQTLHVVRAGVSSSPSNRLAPSRPAS